MWLAAHGEAIEADLLREYQVDLLDWWRGRLTTRRLAALVHHLSPDAILRRLLEQDADQAATNAAEAPGTPPRDLSKVPVAKSLRDAGRFIRGDDLPTTPETGA